MNDREYFLTTSLSYRLKRAEQELAAFRSGKVYTELRKEYEKIIREQNATITQLKKERDEYSFSRKKITNQWMEVLEDMQKEHEKTVRKMKALIRELLDMIAELKKENFELDEKRKKAIHEYYVMGTELEEAKGLITKLTAQVNHNYENSSLPSSKCIGRKKITNNRERTGKKPGAQAGHPHHPRKKMKPDKIVSIPTEEKLKNTKRYVATGKIISRQVVGLAVIPVVTEYQTLEYWDKKKGRMVHSAFPQGVTNDVTYDASMKAILFMLNNRCNVSLEKTAQFISNVTNGVLCPSVGMISGLCKEFSLKSKKEQDMLFTKLLDAPIMHVDGTGARINGTNHNVVVCSNGTTTMYFAREHKGHEGIKETPVETFGGILIHDHEACFYGYGSDHQECLVHIERYLRDSIENERELTWNKEMLALIQKMIHENHLSPNGMEDEKISKFEECYDRIVKKATKEYEENPPSEYYKDGYNLYRRMVNYKHNHLLFLSNAMVPPDNNLCERKARILKGKFNQAISLRSFEHLTYFCESLSVIDYFATENPDKLYESIKEIFHRKKTGKEILELSESEEMESSIQQAG